MLQQLIPMLPGYVDQLTTVLLGDRPWVTDPGQKSKDAGIPARHKQVYSADTPLTRANRHQIAMPLAGGARGTRPCRGGALDWLSDSRFALRLGAVTLRWSCAWQADR